jgi:hypothetical protein
VGAQQADLADPKTRFEQLLKAEAATLAETAEATPFPLLRSDYVVDPETNTPVSSEAAAAYQLNAPPSPDGLSNWEKYKDDQLLRNPGGDHYDLKKGVVTADPPYQRSFWGRVGKDLSDVWGNVKNFFKNLLDGATRCYRDEEGSSAQVRQTGLMESVVEFFKDLGSALSFGVWRPDGESPPKGLSARLQFSCHKVKEAVLADLFQGVGNSVIHLGENVLLAGWNLVEVAPDATIGNLEAGRQLTTKIFDNGQVVVEYLTDVMPAGDAWLRVHAAKFDGDGGRLPLLYNLEMPERVHTDTRWKTIRNTPLRKTIETIGAVVADIVTIQLLTRSKTFSVEGNDND